jgi:hypothetical protein
VQAGWSEISEEEFSVLAIEAEKQARLAVLAEEEEEEEEEEEDSNSDADSDINRKRKEEEDLINNSNSETSDSDSGMHINNDRTAHTQPNRSDHTHNTGAITGTSTLPPKALPPKRAPWSAHRDSLLIGSCPHSWLFGRVGAVVHHGGAGRVTTLSFSLIFSACLCFSHSRYVSPPLSHSLFYTSIYLLISSSTHKYHSQLHVVTPTLTRPHHPHTHIHTYIRPHVHHPFHTHRHHGSRSPCRQTHLDLPLLW